MVEIRGFCGLRFNADKAGALDTVLTPPYDVIDDRERARLAGLNLHNMTHLILPRAQDGVNAYEWAATLLSNWIAEGALVADTTASVYLLRQQFTDPDGVQRSRKAFFALLKLPESDQRHVLGHERTFDKPVEDRLALLRATHTNIEPIFLMYSDPENLLDAQLFAVMDTEEPLLRTTTSDGVLQELWRTSRLETPARHLQGQTLFIADGHHRFRTSCVYRDERRRADGLTVSDNPYDYIMAGFVAFEDPGLKIFAAHRVVPLSFAATFDQLETKLGTCFDCCRIDDIDPVRALDDTDANCAFVLHAGKHGRWLLRLDESKRSKLTGCDRGEAWRALDVAVLHRGIFERLLGLPENIELVYEKDPQAALAHVNDGMAAGAFIMRPTRADQVRACAEAYEPMPQKSTYYFPKLPSGAVLYPVE